MNIELRHFKLIRAIVEQGSIVRAAPLLFQTPSALSYQLKEAESQIGAAVFNRVGKKLVLTEVGEKVLKSARVILSELDSIQSEVNQLLKGENGEIRISTECHTSYYWLPAVLKKFNGQFPNIRVKIVTGGTDHPLPSLLSGGIDMMISYSHKPDPNVVQQELFRDEMLAIVAEDHSWVFKDHINADDFAAETLITHAASLETSNIYEELLKKSGIKPADMIYIPFTDACIELVKAGLGVMVLPEWMLKPYLNAAGLIFKPITAKGVYRHQYISTLKARNIPAYYTHFIAYLKEEIGK